MSSVITLTGPSAAGKSTIERELMKLGCGQAVSHTTRAQRVGEVDGKHYHFVSHDRFQQLSAAGEFVEMIEFGSNCYGMSRSSIASAAAGGKDVVIVVDPHGASQIRRYCAIEGLPVQSVWVDCKVATQAQRFIERLLADMVVGKSTSQAYAERLTLMMTEEHKWRSRAEAWLITGSAAYDQKVSTDTIPAEELARSILQRARKVEQGEGLGAYI